MTTNVPTKKFRASVDDTSFDVEVAGDMVRVSNAASASAPGGASGDAFTAAATAALSSAGVQFVVSPRGQTLDVIPASSGAAPGAPAARTFVATAGDVTWVSIDGEVFTVDLEDAQQARRPRAAAGEGLSAPMPATVIRVLAEPGREVKRGETLLLLEAMKMELPVRAPRDGKVKALHCQAGQLVQPGVPLVDLE